MGGGGLLDVIGLEGRRMSYLANSEQEGCEWGTFDTRFDREVRETRAEVSFVGGELVCSAGVSVGV